MELKTKIRAMFVGLGALKVLSAFKWMPGLGPVAGIASTVLAFIKGTIKGTGKVVTLTFANPIILVAMAFVGMAGLAYGLKLGSAEGRARVAAMQQERDKAYADGEERLKTALAAREAAERAETKERAADVAPMAPKSKPVANRSRPERVRAKSADADRNGFCLPGFPSVWPNC